MKRKVQILMLPQKYTDLKRGDIVVGANGAINLWETSSGQIPGAIPYHLYFVMETQVTDDDVVISKENTIERILKVHDNRFYKEYWFKNPAHLRSQTDLPLKVMATTDTTLWYSGELTEKGKFEKKLMDEANESFPRVDDARAMGWFKGKGVHKICVDFVKEYVKAKQAGNDIKEVALEYEQKDFSWVGDKNLYPYTLRLNVHGCVIPHIETNEISIPITVGKAIMKFCEDKSVWDKLGDYEDFYYKIKQQIYQR